MAQRKEIWQIPLGGQTCPIQVTFRRMKTVRLRVVVGGEIRLSAPYGTDRRWLESFVWEREKWILEHVEKMGRIQSMDKNAGIPMTPLTAAERREAREILIPMVEKWYPVVAQHGVSMPHVTVRRMKTCYGSCSVGRGRITLASLLTKVPVECAEYVVLHELTHFLYPNHGKDFYRFIETHMPDYRQREIQLKKASKTRT